jgi:hypothetical protein
LAAAFSLGTIFLAWSDYFLICSKFFSFLASLSNILYLFN